MVNTLNKITAFLYIFNCLFFLMQAVSIANGSPLSNHILGAFLNGFCVVFNYGTFRSVFFGGKNE